MMKSCAICGHENKPSAYSCSMCGEASWRPMVAPQPAPASDLPTLRQVPASHEPRRGAREGRDARRAPRDP